jgi:hypothetical protein
MAIDRGRKIGSNSLGWVNASSPWILH